MTQRDQVYSQPQQQIVDFAFDEGVAEVFADMIRRSVPGYETAIPLSGLLTARHLAEHPDQPRLVYDLGCSLGASTLAVLSQVSDQAVRVVGVDASAPMIDRARALVTDPRASFECADVREWPLQPASVVLMNFVLQFIAPEQRNQVLSEICASLQPKGLLIISEKLGFESTADQAFYDSAHLDYKRANGYSELEISQKRTALERVMIIDNETQHRERFSAAGFQHVRKWFQCLNWVSYLVYCDAGRSP